VNKEPEIERSGPDVFGFFEMSCGRREGMKPETIIMKT
jgi:hypothetical protein